MLNDKTEIIKNFFGKLISDLFVGERLSLEEAKQTFSKEADKIILDKEREGNKFIEGRFYVRELNGMRFKFSFETYFSKPNGEKGLVVVKSESEEFPLSRLKSEDILKLKGKKELVFEITAPQKISSEPIVKSLDNEQSEKGEDSESNQEKETKQVEIFIPEEPRWTLDEIILPQSVKNKILEVANYPKNSKKVFEDWGLQTVYKQSRRIGINLYGESGTGKTMAAHAIAKHLGRKILIINYADIESKYVGETPKNIRRAFEAAAATNSILFFDEADAILSKRVTNMTSATDVSVNQTRSVMLMLMNDYQDFVIFATNFINNYDTAFMRRISTHIEFKLPDLENRKKLWQRYILSTMPNNVDIDEISEKYDGISGSDIANAVLMAAFKAAQQDDELVDKSLFFEAMEDILASKKANCSDKK